MKQEYGEKRVKALQKEFLFWVEKNNALRNLHPQDFNTIRKKVFRQTWDAYRIGVTGLPESDALFGYFFGWMDKIYAVKRLHATVREEITEYSFRITLEAFRLGAMVAVEKKEASDEI